MILLRILLGLQLTLLCGPVLKAQDLSVGWIGALSGDAAGLGSEIMKGVQLAIAQVNARGGIRGRPVKLLVEDDRYDVATAMSAYEHLKSKVNTHLIFMSTYGALFALGDRPVKDGTLVIDTLDCNDELAKISANHLCLATRTESIAENFVTAIRRGGGGKVAVLYEEEAWFEFIVRTLQRNLGKDLHLLTAPVQSGDYRTQITKAKQLGVRHLILLGNDSMGRAAQQAEDLQLGAQRYSIAGVTSPGFQKLAGKSAEGFIVSHWEAARTDAFAKFREEFRNLHGSYPQLDFVAVPGYDAARLAMKILEDAPADAPLSDLRSRWLSTQGFPGISGLISVDSDGAVRTILERLYTFSNGNLTPLNATVK